MGQQKIHHATLYGIDKNVFHFRLEVRKQPLRLNRDQYELEHALAGRCFNLEKGRNGTWYVLPTDNQPYTRSGGRGIIQFTEETFGFLRYEIGKKPLYFETTPEEAERLTPGTPISFDIVEYQGRRSAIIQSILGSAPSPLRTSGKLGRFVPGKKGGTLWLPEVCDTSVQFQHSQTDTTHRYILNMLLHVEYVETTLGVLVVSVRPVIETGVIVFFNADDGWGFIEMEKRAPRHFRFSALDKSIDPSELHEGMRVIFTSKETVRGVTACTIWPVA